jgi:hypothetical protein
MLNKRGSRLVLVAFCTVCLLAFRSQAAADLITGSQDVMGHRATDAYTVNGTTYGPYGWDYSYTRMFDGTKLSKHLEINFVFDADSGLNAAQQAAYKANAVANIQAIWNNRFVITDTTTGVSYPIFLDPTTTGPTFNQTVAVHKAQANEREDMLNWYADSAAVTMAHEFGHMLGLFDEYIGGAVDQYPNPTLTDTGLMGLGALTANPAMFPRYYQQFLDYMNSLNGPGTATSHTFQLVPVPEPSTFYLAGLASPVLLLVLRRRWQARLAGC